jgi:predicted MFS family arabinose efflux permease
MVGLFEIGVSARLGSVSPIKRMTVGSALVVAGLAITTVSTHWVWFAFSIAVWSVGEILSFAIMSAYTSRLAPADRRGEYFGWIQSSWRLAGVLGPASLMASYEFLGAKTFWPALLVPGIATVWAFTRLGPSSHSHGGTHGPNLPQGLKRLTDRNFV